MTMVMSKLNRYWHTLKYLKLVQFYARAWFKLYRPRVNVPAAAQRLRASGRRWQKPSVRAVSMIGPSQFDFLNVVRVLPSQGGWNDPQIEKLWLYNLHYFDDLNASGAPERLTWHIAMVGRWLVENPPAAGNGWEPYPTSVRIVNWVKWLVVGNSAVPGMLESLATQAGWLSKRLEWHLLGNHLFANAKALVFAGLFFESSQATSWLAKGLKIIERELPEQVLADGGNFERSPMYHAIFLDDLLDLVNAANCWPGLVPSAQVAKWHETAIRMLNWLEGMTHPDGEIAFFNDSALGIAPTHAQLLAYALRLGIEFGNRSHTTGKKLLHFSDSGYFRLQTPRAVAMLDTAPLGPDYLPGHAHADTLSFELSVFGQRVVVNGGTSCYGVGSDRLRERGTTSHSTVEVAGQNSSEVWGGFRVARRAYPFDLQVQDETNQVRVACSHDGYTRLPGEPVHRREWVLDANSLRVEDTVHGGEHKAFARYNLHTEVIVIHTGGNAWQLVLPNKQSLRVDVMKGIGRMEPVSYAPKFGVRLLTQCLVVELIQGQARVEWLWS
jgi:uncharacterized heparinase superfamily protein